MVTPNTRLVGSAMEHRYYRQNIPLTSLKSFLDNPAQVSAFEDCRSRVRDQVDRQVDSHGA